MTRIDRSWLARHRKTTRKSKYNNKRVQIDGIWFDSKKEGSRYGELRIRELIGEIRNLRLQVNYQLVVKGILVCEYRADFVYLDGLNGWQEVVEDAKGKRTREYIIKKKLMKAVHGINILET